jgi:hypothetical protein
MFLCSVISGCAPLIVGAAVGGVAMYAVSKDTIQGETDRDYDSLWNAALLVSRIRGNIKKDDYMKGYIEAEIDSSRVYIRLSRVTSSTIKLRVSARKYHFPNLTLAQDLFVRIVEEAK